MVRIGWPHRAAGGRVELVDVEHGPDLVDAAPLRRIVAEALILQDQAIAVLASVARHEHLGEVAPRGGPLVRRFFALREELPAPCPDVVLDRIRAQLDLIFFNHAMQLATAMEFLAFDQRSEVLYSCVSSFRGLGTPADLLDNIYAELKQLP